MPMTPVVAMDVLGWAGMAFGVVVFGSMALAVAFVVRSVQAVRRRGEASSGYQSSDYHYYYSSSDGDAGNRDCSDGRSDAGTDCGDGGGSDSGGCDGGGGGSDGGGGD
jgi:hypothetical protein